MTARLTSAMLVSALVRRVGAEGGNAVVVAKGDATAGSILLICLDKGVRTAFRERLLGVDGGYGWAEVGPKPDADYEEVESWLSRRRARDPDLWIVELDIPNAERFAAETSGDD
ncbi:DUF1491 family protein [Sphingomonas sp. SUN039]|uniref:DUF1491 family protein n=1 Tax=Sphingomonas sp. SUN039 TaxID=2937787 RepID=UPI0021642012|nr:DUF1491 family protein [Sphingomonas sp. SUN039]UVO55228.1 DUF1491 family protein [Sphingomonas sp. SUN039]